MLCIIHKTSEQAQQIAQSQLSALCRAVGIDVLEDSDQLFQRVLKIRTKIRAAQGDYPAKAEVAEYISAAVPMPATPAPARPAGTNPYAAAKAGAAPAWARKTA